MFTYVCTYIMCMALCMIVLDSLLPLLTQLGNFSYAKLYISNIILLLLHDHCHRNPPHHETWMHSQGTFLDRVVSPLKGMTCPLCLHHHPNHFLSTSMCILSALYQGCDKKYSSESATEILLQMQTFLFRRHRHVHNTYIIAKYQ